MYGTREQMGWADGYDDFGMEVMSAIALTGADPTEEQHIAIVDALRSSALPLREAVLIELQARGIPTAV